MVRIVALLGALFAVALGARNASAQTAPEIEVQADPVVEVGATATVKLQVSAQETPSDPALTASANVAVVGQSSVFQMDLRGMTSKQILVVTFTVQGKSIGNAVVTPSVVVGGRKYTGRPTPIKVVAAGTGPRKPAPQAPVFPFPFGPGFDPFRDLFDDDEPSARLQNQTPTDPKLGLDFAPAPIAFLHASTDKRRAVVGEQVILEIDLYVEAERPNPDLSDSHEPTLSRFIRRTMIDDARPPDVLGLARVGGGLYRVTRIRRAALFPLEAGDLEIGPMQLTMTVGRRAFPRTTDPITIHVTEPPSEGRPTGYVLGHVGEFTLQAEVTPREVKRGDVVSVRLELGGKGNLPASLPTPVRADVEWMEPEVHDQVGRLDVDHWGGKRTFNYVVRMKKEGDIDLGAITLPFWNPEKHAYEIARAELGKIHVSPGALSEDEQPSKLPELPPLKASLAGSKIKKHIDDSPLFWGALLAPVAIFVSAAGARSAMQKTKEAIAKRSASPARELARRIEAAKNACAGTDARAADAAVVRVLEQAAIVKHDVNVRGITSSEAVRALEQAGARTEVARELVATIRACEDARFSPDGGGIDAARERWERAQKVVEDL
jgi:hypothetical protein